MTQRKHTVQMTGAQFRAVTRNLSRTELTDAAYDVLVNGIAVSDAARIWGLPAQRISGRCCSVRANHRKVAAAYLPLAADCIRDRFRQITLKLEDKVRLAGNPAKKLAYTNALNIVLMCCEEALAEIANYMPVMPVTGEGEPE